jgi:hypothetical protein
MYTRSKSWTLVKRYDISIHQINVNVDSDYICIFNLASAFSPSPSRFPRAMVNLKNWKNGGVVGTFPRCKIDQFVFFIHKMRRSMEWMTTWLYKWMAGQRFIADFKNAKRENVDFQIATVTY